MTPQRIQMAREARGLSVEELAERVGVSPDTVRAWESGEVRPRFSVFGRDERKLLSLALQYPPRFFTEPPFKNDLGPTSMDWHTEIIVCDKCDGRIEYLNPGVSIGDKDYHFGCEPRARTTNQDTT